MKQERKCRGQRRTSLIGRVVLARDAKLDARFDKDLPGGVAVVTGEALLLDDGVWKERLYWKNLGQRQPVRITAVACCTWDNRARGETGVWLREN